MFCYVNNNQQNLIFSREIILVMFTFAQSTPAPNPWSGPMANTSVHNTIYQYQPKQPLIKKQLLHGHIVQQYTTKLQINI